MGHRELALSWGLAAAFIAVGCVCFVAGLAWAACFEARERRFLGSAPQGPRPPTPSRESSRTAPVSILQTPPDASANTREQDPQPLIKLEDLPDKQAINNLAP